MIFVGIAAVGLIAMAFGVSGCSGGPGDKDRQPVDDHSVFGKDSNYECDAVMQEEVSGIEDCEEWATKCIACNTGETEEVEGEDTEAEDAIGEDGIHVTDDATAYCDYMYDVCVMERELEIESGDADLVEEEGEELSALQKEIENSVKTASVAVKSSIFKV